MQLLNSIFNLFHIGNTTQTNIISTNPKIDVILRRIEKDFFDGNFKQAVEDLDELIRDNSSEALKSVKYQLLLIKANFLMQFRKIDEFQEFIEHIEKEYKTFINAKFIELNLNLMSLSKNEDFFVLAKQLRLETPNSLPQGHLDIVYYLNSGDVQKAEELFKEEIKNIKYRNKLLLIGGHIYSNLYEYSKNDMMFFGKADKYYQEAIETEKLSFLDTLQIQGFYATHILNNNFQRKAPQDNIPFSVENYKKSLDVVLENQDYFNSDYINIVLDSYLYMLLYLGLEDEYNKFYKKYEENVSIKHHVQYCMVKNVEYDHKKIQECILKNNRPDDLLVYSSLIWNSSIKDMQDIINFLQSNIEFLQVHPFILYSYVKGKILLNNEIEPKYIEFLEDNKYKDLGILLAFIETKHYAVIKISNENIEKLIEFSLNENSWQAIILDVIKLLQKLDKRKEYLDLALKKQNVFTNIIFETLKICHEDKNLLFQEFESFIKEITNINDFNAIIGNIYVKYNSLEKAFTYYYSTYKNNPTIEVMEATLKVVWDHYNKSHEILEDFMQREIFNTLIAKKEDLTFENLIFLLMYAIHILKDTRQILPLLNQELLNVDIENLDHPTKIKLSNIFTQTAFTLPNYKDIFLYELNLCLVQDGKTYIKSNYAVAEENQKNFGFIVIDANEYFLKKQDDTYKEESLFHRLVGPFAFRCENPSMIPILFDTKPLSEFFAIMDEQATKTKELFQRYSDNIPVGLYALANDDYKNYFTLIPYLLNNQNINFNSLHVNYLPKETKKILTLSSIVFLNEINQLDLVLKRDDIVIQQTVVNWLQGYFEKINYANMPQAFTDLHEEGHKFVPFTENSIEEATKFKAFVLSLLTRIFKCQIVNDTFENLSLKEAKTLAPHIGIQEYQALAYCINHNYQIISENNIFDMLFETLKLNKGFLSNATVFLENILEYEKRRSLILDLHRKNYKYVLSANYENNLIAFMERVDISNIKKEEKELIKITNGYGFLENIKKYYNHKFKVLFPKVNIFLQKTYFDTNVEKILKIIE